MATAGASQLTRALLLTLLLAFAAPAHAVQPDEILPNAQMESRARDISANLRCLVCQNQSIDDSNAPLARDLRLLVRERLVAGDTNAEVERFVVQRYGEFVLLRPPFGAHTLLLWLTPVLVFAAAALGIFAATRRRRAAATALTPDEEAQLQALLRREGPGA